MFAEVGPVFSVGVLSSHRITFLLEDAY